LRHKRLCLGVRMSARHRYRGRTAAKHEGLGIGPIVLLLVVAVAMWKLHGGSVHDLRNLQYSIFH
jgi:hypothetical protein